MSLNNISKSLQQLRIFNDNQGKLVFVIGLALFFAGQLSLAVIPMVNRTVPVEADDAYSFIVKAVQLSECIQEECAGLNNLKEQVSPFSSDPFLRGIRGRVEFRVFNFYAPLHSAILALLKEVVGSWELAYNAIIIAGVLLFGFAIAYWFFTLFGAGAAGYGLIILSVVTFRGHGINDIVPWNLSLALTILVWAKILRSGPDNFWSLVLLFVPILALHPIGRVFAIMSLFLYGIMLAKGNFNKRRVILTVLIGLVLLGAAVILPRVIPEPNRPFPNYIQTVSGASDNLVPAVQLIVQWAGHFHSIPAAILLIFIGWLSARTINLQRIQAMSLVLLLGLAGGLMYSDPGILLFERMWIPAAIFGFGLVGQAIWLFSQALMKVFKDFVNRNSGNSKLGNAGFEGHQYVLMLLLIGLVFGTALTRHYLFYSDHYFMTIKSNQTRNDLYIDPSQTEELASLIKPGETVLYDNLTTMLIFFSRDGIHYQTVFYPAVIDSSEEKIWLEENLSISYIVSRNPLSKLLGARKGALGFDNGSHVVLNAELSMPLDAVRFLIQNQGGEATLMLMYEVMGKEPVKERLEIMLPSGFSGWIFPSFVHENIGKIELYTDYSESSVTLNGIQTNERDNLFWPWDGGINVETFSLEKPDLIESISFSTQDLFPFSHESLTVLQDNGSTVLSRLVR